MNAARIHAWLGRTHGPLFELTRHFLGRLFDSELVSTPGEWIRLAAPALAAAFSAFVLLTPMYQQKYRLARADYRAVLNSPERLLQELRFDEQSILTFLMIVTAIFTALFWQSLFPTLRDALALASLPVRPRQIFVAKFAAVTLLFSVYVLAVTAPAAGAFAGVTAQVAAGRGPHFAATVLAWGGACAFVWFSLFALQGLLLNVLPDAWFRRVSVWAQALAFGGAIAAVPLFSQLPAGDTAWWWPPAWFASLWAGLMGLPGASIWPGLTALAAAPLAALGFYAISFHRYRTLLLETPAVAEGERGRWRDTMLRRWIADVREQAMFTFILQSLLRSRTHQFVLLALGALAVSLNLRVVSNTVDPTRELQFSVVFGPIAMSVVAIAGLRYLFALPAELRANWLFRLTEREGRASWLAAVERFVLWFGVALPFAAWFPAAIWSLGIGALIAYLEALAFVMLIFESLFRRWCKAPFACSYLPGKQPLWKGFLVFFYSSWALGAAAAIFLAGVFYPPVFFLSITLLAVLWQRARERRLAEWRLRVLMFEESPHAEVEPLQLDEAGAAPTAASSIADSSPMEEPLWSAASGEESRLCRLARWLGEAPGDFAYALRGFVQRPGFPLGAAATIALGLGLNAAFFSIYDAVYLRKTAVTGPDTLYEYSELVRYLGDTRRVADTYLTSPRMYEELRRRKDLIAEAAARCSVMVRQGDRILVGKLVTPNYFAMLGARAAMGRLFGAEDQTPVMVLSHRAWKSRFASDSGIVGRQVEVRRLRYTVIGVAVPEFRGVPTDREPDFWMPMASWQALEGTREPDSLEIVVRLRPQLTDEQVKAALISTARETRKEALVWAIELRSLATFAGAGQLTEFTSLIFLTFAFTMAIPCANVANMMLARGLERQRELGVRLALGASRGRIVRQLLAEALLVALAGGLAGFYVARAALAAALQALNSTLPWIAFLRFARFPDIAVDWRVFFYMVAVAVVTAVSFALLPALESARWGAAFALRREVAGVRSTWLRDALVIGQVAVCLMLIACSALLLRGTSRFTRTNPGFDPVDLHAVATLDWHVSPEVDRALREQPWIAGVARSNSMPTELRELLVRAPGTGREFRIRHNIISEDYLPVLGVPVIAGRNFTREEAQGHAAVVVVSEKTAQQLWPGTSPLGQVVRIDKREIRGVRPPKANEFLVVGVTRERLQQEGQLTDGARIYFPAAEARLALARGRAGNTRETTARLERLLTSLKTETGLEVTFSMEDMLYFENYGARAGLWVASVLGIIALVLTASGMYGVMSFLAGQRTREIGIRVALGASRPGVAVWMVRYSSRLVAAGLGIGVILGLWAAKLIALRTAYIDVYDAAAYGLGLVVVGLVAVVASVPPALRASQTDPMTTLRFE